MGTAAARGARKRVMVGVRYFALDSMEIPRGNQQYAWEETHINELILQHFKDVLHESGAEVVFAASNMVTTAYHVRRARRF